MNMHLKKRTKTDVQNKWWDVAQSDLLNPRVLQRRRWRRLQIRAANNGISDSYCSSCGIPIGGVANLLIRILHDRCCYWRQRVPRAASEDVTRDNRLRVTWPFIVIPEWKIAATVKGHWWASNWKCCLATSNGEYASPVILVQCHTRNPMHEVSYGVYGHLI